MFIVRLTVYAAAAAIIVIAARNGVTRSLGAHPFWALNIALIGAPIGLAAAYLIRKHPWLRRIGFCVIALIFTGFAAHQGRLSFAASYAENQLAGLFWYYGWIATAAASTALIVAIFTPRPIF